MAFGLCYHRFSMVAPSSEHSETWVTVTFETPRSLRWGNRNKHPFGNVSKLGGPKKPWLSHWLTTKILWCFFLCAPHFWDSVFFQVFPCFAETQHFGCWLRWGKASKARVNQCYQSWRLPLRQDPSSLLSSVACPARDQRFDFQSGLGADIQNLWMALDTSWTNETELGTPKISSDSISQRILNGAQVHGVNCSHMLQ